MFVDEARARLTGSDPPILDSRQPTFVIRDGPGGCVSSLNRSVVPDHEHEKRGAGCEQNPGCDGSKPGDESGRNGEREHAEPGVGEPRIQTLQP